MRRMYKSFLKRIFDICLSAVGIIVLSPLLIVISAAVKLSSRGPVFFRQKRVGRNKSYFNILKFRTMRTDAPKDCPTHLLDSPDMYITGVGRFLRKTSLDELPQLFNILKGEMAIVGPRPALWNQYDLIEERDRYGANGVRPGLTGLAQINGRDELPIDIKAEYDGKYVENIGFLTDCSCIVKTVGKVFRHEGVVEGRMKRQTKTEKEDRI